MLNAKPGEDVKLEGGDVVIAGEVDGGLESHGFEGSVDLMHLVQKLTKQLPRYYCSVGVSGLVGEGFGLV